MSFVTLDKLLDFLLSEFFHYKGKGFLIPIPFFLENLPLIYLLYSYQVVAWEFTLWAPSFFIFSSLPSAHVFS